MKKIFISLILILLCNNSAFTQDIKQKINNDKSYASINLNSQIKPDDNIDKQEIKNNKSWFNININRNTYRFYCSNSSLSADK